MTEMLQILKVAIVDDEELARLRLRSLLAQCSAPTAAVVAELASAAQALKWLGEQRCDLLLLDIHMPGIDGLQLAERLRHLPPLHGAAGPPAVVFVTAHAEHALEAFEVEAVDYLTKPVRLPRLQQALLRAAAWLYRRVDVATLTQPAPLGAETPAAVLVHQRGELLRVPVAEVIYVRADQKYVQLRTAAQSHWLDESLAELAPRLGERFLRIHRNALVARDQIRALARQGGGASGATGAAGGSSGAAAVAAIGDGEGWAVQVAATREWLAVSRRQLTAVREALGSDEP
jgi:two-component system response regulator AlgR